MYTGQPFSLPAVSLGLLAGEAGKGEGRSCITTYGVSGYIDGASVLFFIRYIKSGCYQVVNILLDILLSYRRYNNIAETKSHPVIAWKRGSTWHC